MQKGGAAQCHSARDLQMPCVMLTWVPFIFWICLHGPLSSASWNNNTCPTCWYRGAPAATRDVSPREGSQATVYPEERRWVVELETMMLRR